MKRGNAHNGSVNRLGQMLDRSTSRKKKPGSSKIRSSIKTDALFDMIDQRIGNLLVRSSEIESKLDAIENQKMSFSLKSSHKMDDSPKKISNDPSSNQHKKNVTKICQSSKSISDNQSQQMTFQNESSKFFSSQSHFSNSKQSQKQLSNNSSNSNMETQQLLQTLLETVQSLNKEIQKIKTKQELMENQISQMNDIMKSQQKKE